jgi:hypothetical protein
LEDRFTRVQGHAKPNRVEPQRHTMVGITTPRTRTRGSVAVVPNGDINFYPP